MMIRKNLILDACIEKQNELIDGFKNRLKTMESDAFEHNHTPSQSENQTAGKIELLNAMGNELDFALREMEFLKTLNADKQSTMVEPGAVVVTEKMTFYICVSIEEIEVEGKPFFGISTKAPIYANMRGLVKGDSFSFNETTYIIRNIY